MVQTLVKGGLEPAQEECGPCLSVEANIVEDFLGVNNNSPGTWEIKVGLLGARRIWKSSKGQHGHGGPGLKR